MVAPRRGSGGSGGLAGEGCYHLRGGNRGRWPINMGPAIGLKGTHQTGSGALSGSLAEPAIHGCGDSATGGDGYLATLLTFASCSSAAVCTCSAVPFNACGHFCSHVASLGHSCGFLTIHSCPYGHPTPSKAFGILGRTEPPAGSLAGQWS